MRKKSILLHTSIQSNCCFLLWLNFLYFHILAVIFVIDSNNLERIEEAHEELAKLMAEKRLKDALLLIYANKQVHML